MPQLAWSGDPTILVYAARWALEAHGCHAPQLVAAAVLVNAERLPHGARGVLVRDITAWLDGRGLDQPGEARQPWVDALDALGGPRRAAFMRGELPPPAIPAPRRRADRLDAQRAAS